MRVLYLTHIDFSNINTSGILKKIRSQCKALEAQNCSVDLICVNGKDIIVQSQENPLRKSVCKNKIFKHLEFIKFITGWVKNSLRYDLIYIRLFPIAPPFMFMLSRIRPYCSKIVMEIPTYPYEKEFVNDAKRLFKKREYLLSFFMKARLLIDKTLRPLLVKYIDRIVVFGQYSEIWKIKTIQTINGIDVDSITPINDYSVSAKINIIAVAAFADWHGYDRFLVGMGEYYKNGGTRDICFHVVGDGAVLSVYKDIVQRYNIQNRIIFYGNKFSQDLDLIYNKCAIGLESFGLHRKDLPVSSSLKSREYLAKGLLIVAACDVDILDSGYQYFYQFPADETLVDIEKVIGFYDNIYVKGKKGRREIIEEIRDFAYKTCDMKIAIKPIINYINS